MITRRLILIANNGAKDNFLPAVTLDMQHWRSYFTSPEGGAWRDYEIKFYDNNCTKEILYKYITDNLFVDIWQIIFCGHGYAQRYANGFIETILELSPENECSVSIIKEWLCKKRCLLIADSCRKVCHKSNKVFDNLNTCMQQKKLAESDNEQYLKVCRELFVEHAFGDGKPYFVEGYATSLNECAHDDDGTGGYYSSCLILKAMEKIESEKTRLNSSLGSRKPIFGIFSNIHDAIIEIVNSISMSEYNEPQHPNRKNGVRWPFYLIP